MNKGKIYIILIIIAISCLYFFKIDNSKNNYKTFHSSNDTKSISVNYFLNYYDLGSINYSGKGIFSLINGKVYIIDELFKSITILDTAAKVDKRFQFYEEVFNSKNSNLFNQSMFFLPFNNKYFLLNGRKITQFDNNFKIDTTYPIKFFNHSFIRSILDIPSSDNMNIYEINLRNPSFTKIGDKIIISLESEHPRYNPYISKEYYKYANVFGILDLNKIKLFPTHIVKSDIYNQECCWALGDLSSVTQFGNKIFVQHALDSLIYEYDNDFTITSTFGIMNGLEIVKKSTSSLDIAFDKNMYDTLRDKLSYFDNIFHFTSLNNEEILCRSFVINSKKIKYLQLYKNKNLISSIQIPFAFKYFGSLQNKVYGIIESNSKLKLCVIEIF
jgi:hypothetical protein